MAKMHPIVGGPLDGKKANLASFRSPSYEQGQNGNYPWGGPRMENDYTRPIPGTGGEFFHLRDQYVGFNRSGNSWYVQGTPSFVFFHTSLVPGT
jgi:hypothetical protein